MRSITLHIIQIFLISSMLLLFSCDDDVVYETSSCEDCYVEKPNFSYLEILFSEAVNDSVFIEVYRGYVDQSLLEWSGWVKESPFQLYETPVDNYYSVKATYLVDNASVSMIDGEEMKTVLVRDYCDEDCYVIEGGYYDVKLDR